MSENGDGCGRGTTWPVGSKSGGASPYGAFDMAGNVWEWVADSYTLRHRDVSADASVPPPPADEVTMRVIRGGGWRDQAARRLRTSVRDKRPPAMHAIEVGFRCAADVAQD